MPSPLTAQDIPPAAFLNLPPGLAWSLDGDHIFASWPHCDDAGPVESWSTLTAILHVNDGRPFVLWGATPDDETMDDLTADVRRLVEGRTTRWRQ
jgi:hypothetical protein